MTTHTAGVVELPVLEAPALRSGTPVVTGVVPAGILVARHIVPRRQVTIHGKTGYQREVSNTRVNKLVTELKAGRVDLPTAVLLNIRNFDRMAHLADVGGRKFLRLAPEDLMYVVDGQHRVEALKKLVEEENGDGKWSAFEIAFVCFLGAEEHEEMRQFYVVNSTAKSVRTDLALDLLKQQAESDPNIMQGLIERSEDWKVRGQTLVEELAGHSPAWRGLVRFPGEARGETTIGNNAMVSSLKQLLATPFFGRIKTSDQVRVLDAYWEGIRKVIPEAFESPSDFVLQKSIGVQAMHTLILSVLELVRSKGWSVIEPESYANSLNEALSELQGDTREGGVASGADFWRAGGEGAAGSFSSNAGRRVLVAKIRAKLPSPDVE
ncbi:MAG: DGQHR domain-containing protein [Actinomycetota bacterium]